VADDLIQIRRDNTSDWTASNPVLYQGQLGWDTELKRLKVGDGTTPWNDLAFVTGGTSFDPDTLAEVATTGQYADLLGLPTIPTTPGEVGADPAGTAAGLVATEVTNRNSAIAAAVAPLVSDDELATALSTYATDSEVTAAVAAEAAARATAINNAIAALASVYDTPAARDAAIAAAIEDLATTSSVTSALALKAPLDSPAFTGTPTGITKTHVGLGSVDNTSDANKPVSTAQQTALDAKVAATRTVNAKPLSGDIVLNQRDIAKTINRVTLVTATTLNVALTDDIVNLIGSTVATYTINLPTGAADGQRITFKFGAQVTGLTWTATAPTVLEHLPGAGGTVRSGSVVVFLFRADVNSWQVDYAWMGGNSYAQANSSAGHPASFLLASAATASAIMQRDGSGRSQVVAPAVDADIATKGYVDRFTLNAQTGTTYTLVAGDSAVKMVTLNNASAITLTVPTNATLAFGIGTRIDLLQLGAGQVTVAGAGGVTVNSRGAALKLNGQYARATLEKIATDAWILVGDVTTVTL
jgi:hypothetical protein